MALWITDYWTWKEWVSKFEKLSTRKLWLTINGGAPFRWSFGPNFAWDSKNPMTILTTHPSVNLGRSNHEIKISSSKFPHHWRQWGPKLQFLIDCWVEFESTISRQRPFCFEYYFWILLIKCPPVRLCVSRISTSENFNGCFPTSNWNFLLFNSC